MKNISILRFGACALFVSTCSTMNAEDLAVFTFEAAGSPASSDTSIYSSVTDWNLANSDRDGGTDFAVIEDVTFGGGNFLSVQDAAQTPPVALDAYQSFSLTITGLGIGETINLTSFDYRHSAIGSALSFNSNVFSSLTGLDSGSLGGLPSTNGNFNILVELDLSSNIAFMGLGNGDSIEFRIALRDGSGSVARHHGLDDIVVRGAVIPEPGSYALIAGMLGLGCVMIRRR